MDLQEKLKITSDTMDFISDRMFQLENAKSDNGSTYSIRNIEVNPMGATGDLIRTNYSQDEHVGGCIILLDQLMATDEEFKEIIAEEVYKIKYRKEQALKKQEQASKDARKQQFERLKKEFE